jgi:hypothetical protein
MVKTEQVPEGMSKWMKNQRGRKCVQCPLAKTCEFYWVLVAQIAKHTYSGMELWHEDVANTNIYNDLKGTFLNVSPERLNDTWTKTSRSFSSNRKRNITLLNRNIKSLDENKMKS